MAIDPVAFAQRIELSEKVVAAAANARPRVSIAAGALVALPDADAWDWLDEGGGRLSAQSSPERQEALRGASIAFDVREVEPVASQVGARLESLREWMAKDWLQLESKLRTSIVEGIASFLGLFDDPDVRRVFCPDEPRGEAGEAGPEPLPPLRKLIEGGSVLALNMPSSANPALARAVGVMLKNAWLRAVLERPADMARPENRKQFWRPALFLCDEYQTFATVGENDPSGDEKAFALSRQARVIPIVATQSLASLASATHGGETWKTLLQCFRTRIFLALSDSGSARQASEICGQVERMKQSYSVSESGGRGGVSMLGGRSPPRAAASARPRAGRLAARRSSSRFASRSSTWPRPSSSPSMGGAPGGRAWST